ncbi:MAG: glycosyltransferase family 4 protein [Desulfobacter sp.]
MKIIYITSRFPTGTSEAFLEDEIEELKKRGHHIIVIPMIGTKRIRPEYDNPDASSAFFGLFHLKILFESILQVAVSPCRCLYALLSVTRTRRASIFLKNLLVYPKGLWLARLANSLKADHIHVHWASAPSSMALVACIVSGIPWSLTAHRWDIVENNLLARKFQEASFIRFISINGLELAQKIIPDFKRLKAVVLHMGVHLPHHYKTTDIMSPPFVILCPANLVPVKGHKYLFEAVAELCAKGFNIRLLLAGDGELRDQLERYAKSLGIGEKCSFLGHVNHSQLLDFYSRGEVSIVVLPSVDLGKGLHEGIPVSLIEAMSYGVPVVSTKTGGIPELLNDVSELVPAADSHALADAIAALLTDKAKYNLKRHLCRRRIEADYDISSIVSELENKFQFFVN